MKFRNTVTLNWQISEWQKNFPCFDLYENKSKVKNNHFFPIVSSVELRTSSSLLVNSIWIIFSASVCVILWESVWFSRSSISGGLCQLAWPLSDRSNPDFRASAASYRDICEAARNIAESGHTKILRQISKWKMKKFLSTGSSLSSFLRFDQPPRQNDYWKNYLDAVGVEENPFQYFLLTWINIRKKSSATFRTNKRFFICINWYALKMTSSRTRDFAGPRKR